MLIRRETPTDIDAIRAVIDRAFAPKTMESRLVDELRADPGWIPALSMVAEVDGAVVGHVVCTRCTVDGAPVLGLGPLSVDPPHQSRGVGSALVHAVLGAADALDEPLVVLLGDPRYYHRFGFVLADQFGIEPPIAEWARHFQARPLATCTPTLRGAFAYCEPFVRTY
jgi:putative acetyltransferase